MFDDLVSLSTVGFVAMMVGVVLMAASALSMVGRGRGRLSSGWGPWLLLLSGGVMLLFGRLLLGT